MPPPQASKSISTPTSTPTHTTTSTPKSTHTTPTNTHASSAHLSKPPSTTRAFIPGTENVRGKKEKNLKFRYKFLGQGRSPCRCGGCREPIERVPYRGFGARSPNNHSQMWKWEKIYFEKFWVIVRADCEATVHFLSDGVAFVAVVLIYRHKLRSSLLSALSAQKISSSSGDATTTG